MIIIHGSGLLKHIRVGGRALNLKHFEVVHCFSMESIHICDFDLVSFTFHGRPIDLRLRNLTKLRELNLGHQFVLENNVLGQISAFASSLIILSFRIYSPKNDFRPDPLPELPNVKKLTLTVGAHKDDYLRGFASIANACPNLETFTIEVLWYSPFRRRREARNVATRHPHQHLKLLQFLGYYGRISDFELAAYIIKNAVSLKKVVIDPCCQAWMESQICDEFFIKQERIARSCIQRQLVPIMPRGVDLVLL
ncbi:FBD domain, Leucine-rich repeat domain, L domain-like protein [Artemisia annua]|uniref:FBD domain, Leucine-rich repeat domain, L domain-like protein n=1 Tax=Artemisia annua TaxID=35608 RepID=A0A2U1MGG1_ARTAN|nr:FBD domain, Leucine-rich repeat domain, L domain-like protein [Artemisia annua]